MCEFKGTKTHRVTASVAALPPLPHISQDQDPMPCKHHRLASMDSACKYERIIRLARLLGLSLNLDPMRALTNGECCCSIAAVTSQLAFLPQMPELLPKLLSQDMSSCSAACALHAIASSTNQQQKGTTSHDTPTRSSGSSCCKS